MALGGGVGGGGGVPGLHCWVFFPFADAADADAERSKNGWRREGGCRA